jgi:hypothetical protein
MNVLLEFMRILKLLKMYHDNSKVRMRKPNSQTDIGASLKYLVVSDVPISLPNKQVENYYTYQSIYKGLDANDEFVKQIQMIESILIKDMKNAQEQHKDFKNMITTPEQLEQHKAIDDCVATTSHRVPTTSHRVADTSHRVPTTSHRVPTTSHRVATTSNCVATTKHCVATTSHRVEDISHRVATTSHRVPTTSYRVAVREIGGLCFYGL